MGRRNGKIYGSDIVLIAIFLLSIFIHTEFAEIFFGLFSLRKLFFIGTIPFFILALRHKKNILYFLIVIGTYSIFLIGTIFVPDYFVDTRTLFSILTYCIPFVFIIPFFNNWEEMGVKYSFIISVILLTLWKYMGLFSGWNPNCIAYLYFGGINLYLFIPFHFVKYRNKHITDILYLILYLFGIYLLFNTDSRNVMLAQCLVIGVVIFKKIITKKIIYMVISTMAITYSAVNVILNDFIMNNEVLFNLLLNISNEWFDKNTVFDGRIALQQAAIETIKLHPILGHGHMPNVDNLATHNNYLTLHYSVGLIGILLCSIFLIIIFKQAYENFIYDKNDGISFVSIAILMGFLIQMGAESFLFGNDIIVLMPYFYMGCIIYRNLYKKINFY